MKCHPCQIRIKIKTRIRIQIKVTSPSGYEQKLLQIHNTASNATELQIKADPDPQPRLRHLSVNRCTQLEREFRKYLCFHVDRRCPRWSPSSPSSHPAPAGSSPQEPPADWYTINYSGMPAPAVTPPCMDTQGREGTQKRQPSQQQQEKPWKQCGENRNSTSNSKVDTSDGMWVTGRMLEKGKDANDNRASTTAMTPETVVTIKN